MLCKCKRTCTRCVLRRSSQDRPVDLRNGGRPGQHHSTLQLIAQPAHEQGYALGPGSLCRAEQVPAHHHNNIFWVQDETRYVWGGSKNHRFENNLFYGTHADGTEDARAVRADPMFAGPVRWGAGLDSLTGFTLRPGSPAIRAGLPVSLDGGRDFRRNQLPAGLPPSIGAHELGAGPKD